MSPSALGQRPPNLISGKYKERYGRIQQWEGRNKQGAARTSQNGQEKRKNGREKERRQLCAKGGIDESHKFLGKGRK